MANRRMDTMSGGRYQLIHRSSADRRNAKAGLEIQVLDLSTGQLRGSESLSGGEGFFTSLSLALGLADVVQNRAGGRSLPARRRDRSRRFCRGSSPTGRSSVRSREGSLQSGWMPQRSAASCRRSTRYTDSPRMRFARQSATGWSRQSSGKSANTKTGRHTSVSRRGYATRKAGLWIQVPSC